MKSIHTLLACAASASVLLASASYAADSDTAKAVVAMLKSDFKSKGPATVERVLNQDEAQRVCSETPKDLPREAAAALEAGQLKTVRYPADGNYLGDWKAGERIAQNGRGMQSSDAAGSANGGNCYACHQISKEEISFGNIGPSLYQYGKLRGQTDAVMKYTWAKIYNAQAFRACSSMPRFGHNGILDEKQIRDVMALLLDPASPANK